MLTKLVGKGEFPPGTQWRYSTTGFRLAREVITLQTGKPIAELIQTRLLDPLGIHGMWLTPTWPIPKNIKVAHEWYDLDGDTNYDDITAIPKDRLPVGNVERDDPGFAVVGAFEPFGGVDEFGFAEVAARWRTACRRPGSLRAPTRPHHDHRIEGGASTLERVPLAHGRVRAMENRQTFAPDAIGTRAPP